MRNPALLALAVPFLACAQTITVTSPTTNQTLSGTSVTLSVTYSSVPALHTVEYQVNGERMCISLASPFSCAWNTYYVVNGPYNNIVAVARDAFNNTLATSAAVPFTVSNVLPESASQLALAISTSTPITSSWSGSVTITATISGSNAASHCTTSGSNTCKLQIFVDGKLQGTIFNITGTSTYSLNTMQFDNGLRTVVINLMDNSNPTGGQGGAWNQVAQWEQQITFANGTTAMELRANAREIFLCTTAQLLCPTSFTLTATQVNTDESTQPATSPTYSSSNTAAATVSSSGVVTAVAVGNSELTITSGSLTRNVWVFVNTQNVLPHFGSDGSILTAYNPAKSLFETGVFESNTGLTDTTYPPWTSFQAEYAAAGFNTVEIGIGNTPSGGEAESAFDSAQTSYVSSQVSLLAPYGLYAGLIGDGITRGNEQMYNITRSTGSAYVTPAVQYIFNSWLNNRTLYAIMQDEVQATNGNAPLQGSLQIGNNGFTQIACESGSTCTVTLPNWTFATLCGGAGNGGFIITGSGVPGLDFNTTSGAPQPYVSQGVDTDHFTFPTPSGIETVTYTSSTNPNLTIEPLAESGYDASTSCNGFPCPGPPCGNSAGPLVDWVHGHAFAVFMGWANNVTGRVKMSWPPDEGASAQAVTNWMGDSRMSDFANIYTTSLNGQYLANHFHLSDMLSGVGDSVRNKYANVQRLAPIVLNPSGSNVTWGLQGYSVAVTSIANDVITFSAPHGITTIVPGDTRLSITGNSNSTFNTNYYVRSVLNATQLRVVYQCTTQSGLNDSGGVVTFQDGTIYGNGGAEGSAMDGPATGCPGNLTINNNTPTTFVNKRGQTFTMSGVTGTNASYFNSTTFFYDVESNQNGWNQFNNSIREVPSGSGTGGTAVIVRNNNYVRGVNWAGPGGNEKGARYPFANTMYNAILRAAGTRSYYLGQNFDAYGGAEASYDNTFTSTNLQDIQGGMHARWDYGGAVFTWAANAMASKLIQRLTRYLLQPNLNSPDYGYYIECAARSGSYGNLLMCQSLSDGTLTRTISLSPYLVSGQAIVKHYCVWSGCTVTVLAAGTTSDTVTFDPGGFVDYIFADNPAQEFTAPVIVANLSDVPNAVGVAIQYAYLPYVFTWPSVQSMALPNALSGGSGTFSTLVDKNIGPVYYRLLYLDVNSHVLATSDLQQM